MSSPVSTLPPALEVTFLPVATSTILERGVGSFSATIFLAALSFLVVLSCSLTSFFSAGAATARSRRPRRALSPLGFLVHVKKAWPKLPVEATAGHVEAT